MMLHLHGELGERFGPAYRLQVSSVQEAFRCLGLQLPGFLDVLGRWDYRVLRGEAEMDEVELGLLVAGDQAVHVYPVLRGEKDKGLGKIIVGVALIAGAVAFAPNGTGLFGKALSKTAFHGALGASVTFGSIGLLGVSLVLGGIAQSLTPTPRVTSYTDRSQEKASAIFNGPVNVAAQGVAVPVCFGRFRTGSVVVSAGISTEDAVP